MNLFVAKNFESKNLSIELYHNVLEQISKNLAKIGQQV